MKTKEIELAVKAGKKLPLMEQFYTIQGEGFHKGTAAYFIRLAGCDVGCHWCDVKESWDANLYSAQTVDQLIADAKQHCDLAVITGGEPLMYNLDLLTQGLRDVGIKTHIETSGAHPVSGVWDWFCLSPKKLKLPVPKAYDTAHELKMVIYNKHDFIFAEEEAAKVNENCLLYLQPEWSVREKIMPLIVDYVLAHPQWKVSLQSHKYLNIP